MTRRNRGDFRLFYAADIHGSEPTWRKFIRAAEFYDADALVFGGDLMGKALVPIVHRNGGFIAEFGGERHELEQGSALDAFTRSIEIPGFYWRIMNPDEYEACRADPLLIDGLFQDLARERLRSWMTLAEDRLAGTGVRVYMTGGNDDKPAVLSVLREADGERVVDCESRVVELDGGQTMITVGLSTHTPWDTPREASEEEISATIARSADVVPDLTRCIFNLHCPPKGTSLDRCVKLERAGPGELPTPVREAGRFVMTQGGSEAVKSAVAGYQPLLGLHGHIHESPGRFRIGRTQCFNPGSEYDVGLLQGVIVQLRDTRITAYQRTSG